MRLILSLLVLLTLTAPLFAAGRPMTVDDLLAVKGVSDPQVSPDGRWVVYVVSELVAAGMRVSVVGSRGAWYVRLYLASELSSVNPASSSNRT